MQPRRLALGGGNDHAGIGAGDHGLGELAFDQVRLAGKGAVDDRIDLQFGRIGDHRHHVVERDLALAVRVERELAQFVARGLTVAAEQRHQRRARVGRDPQVRDPQFIVDQFREVALAVGIAADRDRGLGALAGLAQRRLRPQLAGLDHDAAILQAAMSASVSTPLAKLREPARTRIARRPPNSGTVMASSTSRDGSAESSSPSSLHQRKRIVGIVDRGRQQRVGALAHQAGIGTVEQDDGPRRIGPGEKSVDLFSAKRDHVVRSTNWLHPEVRVRQRASKDDRTKMRPSFEARKGARLRTIVSGVESENYVRR